MTTKIVSLKDQVRSHFDTLLLMCGNREGWYRVTENLAVQISDSDIVRAVTVTGGQRRIVLREFKKPIPLSHWSTMSTTECVETWSGHHDSTFVPRGSSVQIIVDFMNR